MTASKAAPERSLILASASPRRNDLLAEAGYVFEVAPADVDESLPGGMPPEDAAVEVARRKALAVAAAGSVVLAADTIVVTPSGEIVGKPVDAADARRMLRRLSGTTHVVVTGILVTDAQTGAALSRAVATRVFFARMTDAEIDAYVESGEALGKAGAYAIQETGDRFVTRIEGSYTNVVGLPMEAVRETLAELGVRPAVKQGAAEGG